jgi:hypothetical protein
MNKTLKLAMDLFRRLTYEAAISVAHTTDHVFKTVLRSAHDFLFAIADSDEHPNQKAAQTARGTIWRKLGN